MKRFKLLKNEKGIILMEALVALAVIVIVMTALVTALVSAISSTTFSNEQTTATAYAQEGMDFAREFKNRDFTAFSGLNGEKNLGENPTGIPSGTGSLDSGKYRRFIFINTSGVARTSGGTKCNQDNGPSIFVASVVQWSDSRCSGSNKCHEVELSSCFANLNYIEGP